MFLKKLFSKSFEQTLQKGDSLFTDERYSEARQYYYDALDKMPDSGVDEQTLSHINSMISKCGNNLACMNIAEAEAAIRSGNSQKAAEYLELSLEQADDVSVREKTEVLISSLTELISAETRSDEPSGKHACASCSSSHNPVPEPDPILPDHLHSHEQFQLLVNTLPGDLPQRYASLGEEFASAYLLAHSENTDKALSIFRQLLSDGENDILLYETALLEFRAGRIDVCESLLKRGIKLNPDNPVCNLSLAQLFADTGRLAEAAVFLKNMMDRSILYDQALVMLADVYTMQGDHENAVTLLSSGLQMPALKKASAERLVRILASQGRDDEAAYLVKTYLKGCC
jgi:predicted Zn-dependent protease